MCLESPNTYGIKLALCIGCVSRKTVLPRYAEGSGKVVRHPQRWQYAHIAREAYQGEGEL